MMHIRATHLPTDRTVMVQDIMRIGSEVSYYVSGAATEEHERNTVEGWCPAYDVELHLAHN